MWFTSQKEELVSILRLHVIYTWAALMAVNTVLLQLA